MNLYLLVKEFCKLGSMAFSERNLRYMKSFYLLYSGRIENPPQVVANSDEAILPQVSAELFMMPWGHHQGPVRLCFYRYNWPLQRTTAER